MALANKVAISVPDATFPRVEKKAAELGVSLSRFYSIAAERYLHELESDDLTARIDEAIARSDPDQVEAREFAALSMNHLAELLKDDEW